MNSIKSKMIMPKISTAKRSVGDKTDNFLLSFIRQLFLIVTLYIYLYNPIFLALGIGSIKLLLITALIYALIKGKVIMHIIMQFKHEAVFTFVIIIYASLTVIRGDLSLLYIPYSHFIWFMECVFLPLVLVIWFRKELAQHDWEKWVVIIGFIAALITLILILHPEWNEFVRTSLISYSLADSSEWWFRGFGIAEGLAGSYGIIQGIILGICLYMLSRHVLYAVPIIPILLSIAFNARTGFIAVAISLLLIIIQRRFSIRLASVVIGVALIIVYILDNEADFIYKNLTTIEWAISSFTQTGDFASGNASEDSVFHFLLKENFFIPQSTVGWLLGDGTLGPYGTKSDNGYSNQLMFGGIFYMLLLLGFFAYMYVRLSKKNSKGFYPAFFLIVLLIVNIKYNCLFVPDGVFRLFSFYYVLSITRQSKFFKIIPHAFHLHSTKRLNI